MGQTIAAGSRLLLLLTILIVLTAALLPAEEQDQPAPIQEPFQRPVAKPYFTDLDPKAVKALQQEIRQYLLKKTGKNAAGTALPAKSPWVWCSEQYDAVPKQDPKILYGLIAEHVAIADNRFLKSKDVDERRKGLGMVSEAGQCASQRVKDHVLAVKICEGYLMPHFEAADERHWKYLGRQNILEVMMDIYAEAKDPKKMIEIGKLLLANAPNRNTADGARLRLAQLLDQQGDYREALRYLKEIDEDAGVGGARRLIPIIEKKLKMKP